MTEVLQSPSHFPSCSSSSSPYTPPTATVNTTHECDGSDANARIDSSIMDDSLGLELDVQRVEAEQEEDQEIGRVGDRKRKERDREGDQISVLALLVAAFRKSLIRCNTDAAKLSAMEIGWPSNVRHVAHVTFDRFHGFLGLPVEFEPEVPRRPPSASTSVFGVSTESMQLSFDARGNSVPTILLLMQRQLYAQGGLQAEGIFRINAENGQEESVREQLNRGIILEGIDVHCLAGLIKAWFRELPAGLLDSLSPEQVMQSQSEEECARLMRLLPSTEAALLDWAINLMADVAQMEHLNKMNARNVAMVFAPNMTQMADPLTALMYAVEVMNFLKTLVVKTLKERTESMIETAPSSRPEPFRDDEHQGSSQPILKERKEDTDREIETETVFVDEEPNSESTSSPTKDGYDNGIEKKNLVTSIENVIPGRNRSLVESCPCGVVSQFCSLTSGPCEGKNDTAATKAEQLSLSKSKYGLLSGSILKKVNGLTTTGLAEKNRGTAIISHISPRTELIEAWR